MKNKRRTSSPDKMRYMPGSVASARYHAVEAVDPDDFDDCEDEEDEELVIENTAAATGRVQVGRSVRVAHFRVEAQMLDFIFFNVV